MLDSSLLRAESTNKNTNKKKSVSFTALNAPHFWGRWGFAHGLLFFKQQALNQKVQVGVCCWTASGFQQQVQPQKISPGSRHGMAVRHCSLCSGHAQAYWRGFMGHQRQQPLQRVGCLRQAMYQLGLVAAALRPASAFPAASPCAFACGSHLIDSSRGAFSERGKQDGFQGQGSADFGATPPCLAMPLPCWCCRQPNPAHQACVPTFSHQATVQLRATKTTARALQKTLDLRVCAPCGFKRRQEYLLLTGGRPGAAPPWRLQRIILLLPGAVEQI